MPAGTSRRPSRRSSRRRRGTRTWCGPPTWADVGKGFDAAGLELEVVERVDGDASTAFGVPSRIAAADRAPVDASEAARLAALVEAAWATFDRIASGAPAELRKGPRGGGRDTAKIVEHVHGGDDAYAAVLGIPPADRRPPAVGRQAVLEILRRPSDGSPIAGKQVAAPLRGPPDRLARPRPRLGDRGPHGPRLSTGPGVRHEPVAWGPSVPAGSTPGRVAFGPFGRSCG